MKNASAILTTRFKGTARLRAALMGTLLAALSLGPLHAAGFLSAMDDMPLAAGVEEIQHGAIVFDKPEGRIVQVTALRSATATPATIRRFYTETLPNLGWRVGVADKSGLTFTRKGEILRIILTADLVIFDLAPNH